jgi:hypothetical protein
MFQDLRSIHLFSDSGRKIVTNPLVWGGILCDFLEHNWTNLFVKRPVIGVPLSLQLNMGALSRGLWPPANPKKGSIDASALLLRHCLTGTEWISAVFGAFAPCRLQLREGLMQ